MRRHAKTDDNQTEIVKALRAHGCSVVSLADVGGGVPDLLVGKYGRNYLLEVKDGRKPPSKRTLTADQIQWHARWKGHACIVHDIEGALAAVGIQVEG